MAETLRLPALSFSAAELMHGPRAAISHDTPVLTLRLADQTAGMIDTLVATLRETGQRVHLCGGPATSLPWIGDDHPVTDAITLLARRLSADRSDGAPLRFRSRPAASPQQGDRDGVKRVLIRHIVEFMRRDPSCVYGHINETITMVLGMGSPDRRSGWSDLWRR